MHVPALTHLRSGNTIVRSLDTAPPPEPARGPKSRYCLARYELRASTLAGLSTRTGRLEQRLSALKKEPSDG